MNERKASKMRARLRPALIGCLVVLAAVALWRCSPIESDEEDDLSVTMEVKVVRDDLFGLQEDKVIGEAKFDQKEGQAGLRIKSKITVETLSRFPEQRIAARLELQNQDAAREPWPAIEWTQDTNTQRLEFVVPLVETIPSYLNFRVVFYYPQDESETAALRADDDTSPADDDTTPPDDDASPTDDDTTPPPNAFEAEAVFEFLVNAGEPSTGN
jgi:hypothetical protein